LQAPADLDELDEPVRRYLKHSLADGVAPQGVRLRMAGRIKVGAWLAFTAEQEFSGRAFLWRARAGWGPLKPLHVVDSYRDGAGSTDGRESIWVPGMLVPGSGVSWRAESENRIVASIDVPPERSDVTLRIDDEGAVRAISLMRWGNVGQKDFGYIPFGGDMHAERRFGPVVLPSEVTVGWWYGTPRYQPFFEATILEAVSVR
jgi:hypothetical protein